MARKERIIDLTIKIKEGLRYFFNNLSPYVLALITIAYLSGFIFIATQNALPYIQTSPNSSPIIIYPNTSSQQTILETVLVYIVLLLIYVSLLALYIIGTRRYHAKPPTTLLSLSIFMLFVLFFILWVILLQKVP